MDECSVRSLIAALNKGIESIESEERAWYGVPLFGRPNGGGESETAPCSRTGRA